MRRRWRCPRVHPRKVPSEWWSETLWFWLLFKWVFASQTPGLLWSIGESQMFPHHVLHHRTSCRFCMVLLLKLRCFLKQTTVGSCWMDGNLSTRVFVFYCDFWLHWPKHLLVGFPSIQVNNGELLKELCELHNLRLRVLNLHGFWST